MTTSHDGRSGALWLAVLAGLGAATTAVADAMHFADLHWWAAAPMAGFALVVTVGVTFVQETARGGVGWAKIFAYRTAVWLAAGTWTTWACETTMSWDKAATFAVWWLGGVIGLAAFGAVCHLPNGEIRYKSAAMPGPAAALAPVDGRPKVVTDWEARIRQVSKLNVTVEGVTPWEHPEDGMRLHVALPIDKGTTTVEFAGHASNLAAAARLPRGCVIQVVDSDRQGMADLDIMLRNNLLETPPIYTEPATPASINDEFVVIHTPRGEPLRIGLRIPTLVIGGGTGSGKTTLLHRIVKFLARCPDGLIWVIDPNGGGVAAPWIDPWLAGRAAQPIIDWVASTEEEAALMVAVAAEVARRRKTDPEAKRRRRAANSSVLPVTWDMPAILVITDEGGELRKTVSRIGLRVGEGVTRLAEIGRAEGVRPVFSVLRGTSDRLDKAMRVQASIRIAMRMNEADEYSHILGVSPGKGVTLAGTVGGAFLLTENMPRPVLGQTLNLDLAGIDDHAIACADLRPPLDAGALDAAAHVTPAMVLDGRDPSDFMDLTVLQDAAVGRAYTGRWDRYQAYLAGAPATSRPSQAQANVTLPADGPLATLVANVNAMMGGTRPGTPPVADDGGLAGARIYQFPHQPDQRTDTFSGEPAVTGRAQILSLIEQAGYAGIGATALEDAVDVSRARVYELLKDLRARNLVTQLPDNKYVMADVVRAG